MTPLQVEQLSHKWFVRTIRLEIVSSAGHRYSGPDIEEVVFTGNVREWKSRPWRLPTDLLATHLNWIAEQDGCQFHRNRIDPPQSGKTGDVMIFKGKMTIHGVLNSINSEVEVIRP